MQSIRPRAANAEDQKQAAETTAALARLPRPGNGPGAKFGTREPTICATRTAPARGAPSPEQARLYAICDTETVVGSSLMLISHVKVQVAPASHPPNQIVMEIHAADIKPGEPVWDIRGSLTYYACRQAIDGANPFARTHNCTETPMNNATGYCYKNTFGDWHCAMSDIKAVTTSQNVLPPEGN